MTDKPSATATAESEVQPTAGTPEAGRPPGHAAGRVRGLDRRQLINLALRYTTLVLLAALVIAATILDDTFWDENNLRNLITQFTPIGLVAIGMTYVIIAGNFDLSVGAIFLGSTLLVAGITGELPIWLAMVVTVLVGMGLGLVNGLIITQFRVNSFIATIGTGSIIGGLALVYSDALPVSIPPDVTGFNTLGAGLVFGFPWAGVLLIAAFALFAFLLHRTVYGRWVYAVGGNAEAARLVGIRVNAVKVSTFATVGAFAALAGVVTASNLNGFSSPAPTIGASTALDAFTIVVIGGTSVYGGEGALWRTASGLAIYAVLQNLFNTQGLSFADQRIAMGVLLVLALGLNALGKARGA
ncbi:MAG TPA: ABC transporter permease [Aeromicrobium sp.]|nr:ABC transporter permease [Aeromicrobium sp.]